MKNFKEKNPRLVKILSIVLLVLTCCPLSYALSVKALHWKICKNPDHSNTLQNELFWQMCKEEQEALFWETCREFDLNPPPNTEVLVSACTRPSARGVPGGEVLFVHEGLTDKTYLLDLRTGEKKDVPDDPLLLDHGVFLSSELVWLESGVAADPHDPNYRPHYILDLTDGQRYELFDVTRLPRLDDYKFDPKYYSYFTGAEQVFIDQSKNTLIALSINFRQHPKDNVIISQFSLGSASSSAKNGELLEQLMKDLGVDYQTIDFSLMYADVPSPTGKYIVRGDGIYLSKINTPVVSHDMGWYFRGWYYDESGVVFHEGTTFLYHAPFGGGVGFPVSYPILKLRLPAQ
jgi:hypothetical protein